MVSKVIIKWLKLTFVLSTASFLIIQIQMRRGGNSNSLNNAETFDNNGNHPRDMDSRSMNNWKLAAVQSSSNTNDSGKAEHPIRTNIAPPPPGLTTIVEVEVENNLSLNDIRQLIDAHNSKSEVYNERELGPIESNGIDYVLVVQVHNRTKYLEQLIDSLSKSRGIERALLIFSHDYYSPSLNRLIRNVKFCRVMQIFYPYSMQTYPDRFPGQDPRDCRSDVGREKAKEMECQNWKTPDKYGHYRVAQYSQVKHHWWWKMNYVFDGIPRLRNYTGWVLRLEEDHYVSPDFLHTFDYMVKNKEKLCAECSVITLGFYLKSYNLYSATMSKLAVYPWFSSRHNMGMAINRASWNLIHDCAELFCSYDDYNWDWALMHVNLKCLKQRMTVIYAKSPRVFHIGDCGIHHTGKQCTADSSAAKVKGILENVKNELFPDKFEVGERSSRSLKAPKENGGWGDTRDHELCRNNSNFLNYFH